LLLLGGGKITPDRIARLDAVGFEWDPQKAQWDKMFERLKEYYDEMGHCKVPKVCHIYIAGTRILPVISLTLSFQTSTFNHPVMGQIFLLPWSPCHQGYTHDPELANWVRNQRLEHANMNKGKKSRMTKERFKV
jgi:hypothetical protein